MDVLGQITRYVYDDAGRPIRTIANYVAQGSSDPATWVWNTTETRWKYGTNNVQHGNNNDQNIITEQVYDRNGNVIQVTDVLRNRSFTRYDELNRVIRTVRNARSDAVPYSGYTDDPLSAFYWSTWMEDRDLTENTDCDAMGRVIRTSRLVEGNWAWQVTLNGYDPNGRLVRVIQNASDSGYDLAADPDLSGYMLNSAADKDIVTTTEYDAQGRVLQTLDTLSPSRKTRPVYDSIGRQFRTITNYVEQGNPVVDPKNWYWNGSNWQLSVSNSAPVIHGTDNDENQISHTEYDAEGRVWWTQDVQGRKTWQVYDAQGRRIKTVVNCTHNGTGTAPENASYVGSNDSDKDIITKTEYDTQGRVRKTFDALGRETRFEYDALGRRTKTITNYVDGVYSAATPDEDLIETTTYDFAGRVVSTIDARGTKTTFTYDNLGRRITVTLAADTPLAVKSFTCFNIGGQVLRTIQNWLDNGTSPNAKDSSGNWLFNPTSHGTSSDQNLITAYTYDAAGRVLTTTDPMGNVASSAYFKDGQAKSQTDPMGVVTAFRYDGLRRRLLVVQNYVPQGVDPVIDPINWVWDDNTPPAQWEYNGNAVNHNSPTLDQNIIVRVVYDKVGRMTSLRNPKGALTSYTYDKLERRKTLTNPLTQTWTTAYSLISGSPARTTRTILTDANGAVTWRDTDLLGRLKTIKYQNDTADKTPDVAFTYDKGSNRTQMSETNNAGGGVRGTTFTYDKARRLKQVDFDNDGNNTIDETVKYEYDAGGRRTKLTLPGNLNVTYSYDARGLLISLTNWDNQTTTFGYDGAGRHNNTTRANGLVSSYQLDANGRLTLLRHVANGKPIAEFGYVLDARGNRILAREMVQKPGAAANSTYLYNDTRITYRGWANAAPFKASTEIGAVMMMPFYAAQISFTYGTGTDHGLFDVYVGGTLWQTFDGYATTAGELTANVTLPSARPTIFEIRCRREKHPSSAGYKVRFKQLVATLNTPADQQTMRYTYDALSRLRSADYSADELLASAPSRRYEYFFDLAGNRTKQIATVAGALTTTEYDYADPTTGIVANQLRKLRVNGGAWTSLTYDNNGNMLNDGTNAYTWDRANRLLTFAGASYAYDGMGSRVKQTVGANVTKYLLDLQPGLSVVLADTTGANTNRYIHAVRGIHAQKDAANNWEHMTHDGLGSVRSVLDNSLNVLDERLYDPYGTEYVLNGTRQTSYGFTGEWTNGLLVHLRARDYHTGLGIFPSRDPYEGTMQRPMSLNGYSWVEGNVVNAVDVSGMSIDPSVSAILASLGLNMVACATVATQEAFVVLYSDKPLICQKREMQ